VVFVFPKKQWAGTLKNPIRYCVKKDKVNQTFVFVGGIEFILNRIQTFTC